MGFNGVKHIALGIVLPLMAVSGCASHSEPDEISLPLLTAWYDGEPVHYVTTDVSDQALAKEMGANYAPRLYDAVPDYPKPPGEKTVLERVYAFPQGTQSRNVFASKPTPVGYASDDKNYSPIWLLYKVEWKDPDQARELRSEGAIFKAKSAGLVSITRTPVVINCPVVSVDGIS